MTSRPTPEDVLAQAPWVRALARRLVSDAHLAEDLAQETMAAALERPPERALSLRPWLARVLRNFLGQVARAEGRRRLREEVIARRAAEDAGAADRPDRLVEELALHRELTDAVLALDEPYRSTIVLRFLRELPPREIARRQGVPVKTVDSRIARGLARLRARLDRDAAGNPNGDSRAWVLSLATVLEAEPGLGLATPGVLLVNTKLVLSALSIAAVCVAAVWLGSGPAAVGTARSRVAAAPPEEPRPLPSASSGRAAPRPGQRSAAERPSSPAPVPADAAGEAPTFVVRGRVLDTEGAALAGVPVGPVGARERAVQSGAGGWFELESASPAAQLAAFDPRFVTVRRGVFSRHDDVAPAVVVAPAVELSGVVVDEAGRPLDGARLRLEPPSGLDARIGWNLESSAPMAWGTASGEDGSFRFEALPAIAGASLMAVLDGYEAAVVPAPASSQAGLELVLARPRVALAGALSGRVLDPSGAPVPGARVALGLTSALTDEQGAFRLDLARAVTADTLRAVRTGFLPAIMERPFEPRPDEGGDGAASEARALGWPEEVELRLPGPALSIAGRVLDHRGEPVGGVRLWIADPTPFGVIGRMPATLEGLMGGAEVPPQALEQAALGPTEDGDLFWDMHTSAGPSTAFWSWVRTGDDGRFELPGLSARSYLLKVMDDATLRAHVSEPVRAGDHDVELRLPEPELWPVLAGRVVAEDGTPLEGVRVRLAHEAYGDRSRVFGGELEVGLHQSRETVATDAEGRFRFEDVPRQSLYLALASNDVVPASHRLGGDEEATDLRVVVEARCHVEVLLERTPGAAYLSVYDGDDRRLDVLRVAGESISATTEIVVVDGATGVFSTSARAASLRVLDAEGEPLARLPVRLVPGRVNLVRD